MKRISILGSTGSIGKQTLDVVREHKDKFEVNEILKKGDRVLVGFESPIIYLRSQE